MIKIGRVLDVRPAVKSRSSRDKQEKRDGGGGKSCSGGLFHAFQNRGRGEMVATGKAVRGGFFKELFFLRPETLAITLGINGGSSGETKTPHVLRLSGANPTSARLRNRVPRSQTQPKHPSQRLPGFRSQPLQFLTLSSGSGAACRQSAGERALRPGPFRRPAFQAPPAGKDVPRNHVPDSRAFAARQGRRFV